MQTILVPTDFSPVSLNAAYYACELARLTHARIILLHVYTIPAISTETEVLLPITQLEESGMEGLNHVEQQLRLKFGQDIAIQKVCKGGYEQYEINSFATENKTDLIVMGMHGAGYLTEKLIGSVTTAMIQKANCPVLAIHNNTAFKSPVRIVLASDYNDTEKQTLHALIELAQVCKAHIYILNVMTDAGQLPTAKQASVSLMLEHALEAVEHSFHAIVEPDIMQGIEKFAKEFNADMVAMIPHHHSFLNRLLHEPTSTRQAFHTALPLLALH